MTYKDHKPADWGFSGQRCIWDHEPWPCETTRVAVEVIRDVAKKVRPVTPEPMDSEISFERWQTRHDVAEEIEDMIPEDLK